MKWHEILKDSLRIGGMEDGGRVEKRRWLFEIGRMVRVDLWV